MDAKSRMAVVPPRVEAALSGTWAVLRRGWFSAVAALVAVVVGLVVRLNPPRPVVLAVGGAAVVVLTLAMWRYYGREECTCSVTRL